MTLRWGCSWLSCRFSSCRVLSTAMLWRRVVFARSWTAFSRLYGTLFLMMSFEPLTEDWLIAVQNHSIGSRFYRMRSSIISLRNLPAREESDGTTESPTLSCVVSRIALWLRMEEVGCPRTTLTEQELSYESLSLDFHFLVKHHIVLRPLFLILVQYSLSRLPAVRHYWLHCYHPDARPQGRGPSVYLVWPSNGSADCERGLHSLRISGRRLHTVMYDSILPSESLCLQRQDYTPTVGLGCRSGGYMIYVVNTMFLFLVEMLCWGIRTSNLGHRRWIQWIGNHLVKDLVLMALHNFERKLNRANTGKFTKLGRRRARRMREWWENSKWTNRVDIILRLIEIGNLVW